MGGEPCADRAEVQTMMQVAMNPGNKIDIGAFLALFSHAEEDEGEQYFDKTYKLLDPHDRGEITREVVSQLLKDCGETELTEEELDLLMKRADVDGDGIINKEDLSNL